MPHRCSSGRFCSHWAAVVVMRRFCSSSHKSRPSNRSQAPRYRFGPSLPLVLVMANRTRRFRKGNATSNGDVTRDPSTTFGQPGMVAPLDVHDSHANCLSWIPNSTPWLWRLVRSGLFFFVSLDKTLVPILLGQWWRISSPSWRRSDFSHLLITSQVAQARGA